MPLITVTVRKGRSSEHKSAILTAVHSALVASGVPDTDRFHRVLELGPDDFRFDPQYPDVAGGRNGDFILIEILLSVGRSVKVKRKILSDLLASLKASIGADPENVMVVFKETQWENWAFAGGRILHAA